MESSFCSNSHQLFETTSNESFIEPLLAPHVGHQALLIWCAPLWIQLRSRNYIWSFEQFSSLFEHPVGRRWVLAEVSVLQNCFDVFETFDLKQVSLLDKIKQVQVELTSWIAFLGPIPFILPA